MVQNDKRLTAEKTVMALEEVLGRLEKALASKQVRSQSGICEQTDFIHQLEKENRALTRELDVARAIVSGSVSGKIRVRDTLIVESTGRVSGHLDASVVEMHPGASIDALVRISGVADEY